MNSTDLDRIYDKDALPVPFIVKDKHVLVQPMEVEEIYKGSDRQVADTPGQAPQPKLVIGTSDNNSAKTVHAKVVGIPNFTRGHYADGFALGDIVMIHEMVGNGIYLEGVFFRVVRAEDVVGWYELSKSEPISNPNTFFVRNLGGGLSPETASPPKRSHHRKPTVIKDGPGTVAEQESLASGQTTTAPEPHPNA